MTDPIANLLPCPFCGAEPCFEKPSPTAWEIVCRAMSCCFNPSTGWMQNQDGCITIWNTRALPAPPVVSTAERFLCKGTAFKLHFNSVGNCTSMGNYANELEGQWVALVPAEDMMHLKSAPPAPAVDAVKWDWVEGEDGNVRFSPLPAPPATDKG